MLESHWTLHTRLQNWSSEYQCLSFLWKIKNDNDDDGDDGYDDDDDGNGNLEDDEGGDLRYIHFRLSRWYQLQPS